MAGGYLYRDTWSGPVVADQSGITLTTTHKALWPVALTTLPANFWTLGRLVSLTAFCKWSTGTAGNYQVAMAFGSGDNPACLVNSTARAFIASVGPFPLMLKGYARCRSVGTAGTLEMWGKAFIDLGAVLSTAQPTLFPSAGGTVVSTIDTTSGTLALTFQMLASAGTHTVTTVGGPILEVLN